MGLGNNSYDEELSDFILSELDTMIKYYADNEISLKFLTDKNLDNYLPTNELDYLAVVDLNISIWGSIMIRQKQNYLPSKQWFNILNTGIIGYSKEKSVHALNLNELLKQHYDCNHKVETLTKVKKLFFDVCKKLNVKPVPNITIKLASIKQNRLEVDKTVFLLEWLKLEHAQLIKTLIKGVSNNEYYLVPSSELPKTPNAAFKIVVELQSLTENDVTKLNTTDSNMLDSNRRLFKLQDNLYTTNGAYDLETAIQECYIYEQQNNLDMGTFTEVAKQYEINLSNLIYNYYNNNENK